MTKELKDLRHARCLEQIAAYFRTRFREDPELAEIHFLSAHEMCSALNKAGVSLWTLSDSAISAKLFKACNSGAPVRGNRHFGEWTFYRQDYL